MPFHLARQWHRWACLVLWAAAAIVFVAPLFVAPLGFPPYYEDESWVFLPVFELLRGNGPSMGALNEGPVPFVVHSLAVTPAVALSPFSPELTVRIISTVGGLFCAAGTAALGLKISPRAGVLAIAFFLLVPMLYATGRYGRTDMLALGLGLWGMATANRHPALSGVLCALAVCVHPIMVWILPPALLWNWHGPGGVSRAKRFAAVVGVIGLIQVAWLLANFSQVQEFIGRMFVSSSVAKSNPLMAIASSLAHEADRYIAYWNVLAPLDRLLQSALLGALGITGVAILAVRRQPIPLLMLLGSMLAIAVLIGTKNLYYLIFCLPLLAAIAPVALEKLPHAVSLALAAVLIGWTGVRQIGTAAQSTSGFEISRVTMAIAKRLPQGAVVIAPLVDAGLVRLRPDLRYFSYHALSDRNAWRLPPCETLPQRIADLVENDLRSHPQRSSASPGEAYVGGIAPGGLLGYLRAIYVDADPSIEACLLDGPRIYIPPEETCSGVTSTCSNVVLARIGLPPPLLRARANETK
jgi:hypothetical protein